MLPPPKSLTLILISLAPPTSNKIEVEALASQRAPTTSPWLGDGRRGSSLGLWPSLKGSLAVVNPLSLAYLSCIRSNQKSLSSASSLSSFNGASRKRSLDPCRSREDESQVTLLHLLLEARRKFDIAPRKTPRLSHTTRLSGLFSPSRRGRPHKTFEAETRMG